MHLAATHDGECRCLSTVLHEDRKEPVCSESPLSSIFSLKIGTCFCFTQSWNKNPGDCFWIWTSVENYSSLAILPPAATPLIQNPM